MKYAVTVDDETYIIEINQEGQVLFGDLVLEVDFAQVGDGDLYSLLVNNE
jgi:hypothetical protein